MNENKNITAILKQNIDSKLNCQESLIETNNFYCVFLENNKFLVCEEYVDNLGEYQIITLYNFFNGEEVLTNIVDEFSFCESKIFYTNNNLKAIVIPIRMLLNKYIKGGMIIERKIINTYNIINDYLNENPTFIEDMFEEKKSSKQI